MPRIPLADDYGLGQRKTNAVAETPIPQRVIPKEEGPSRIVTKKSVPQVDVPRYSSITPSLPNLNKNAGIVRGLNMLAGEVAEIGLNEKIHQDNMTLIANKLRADEEEQRLKQAYKVRQEEIRSKAALDMLSIANGMHDKTSELIQDSAKSAEQKAEAFGEYVNELQKGVPDIIPKEFQSLFLPQFMEHVYRNEERLQNGIMKEKQDATRANLYGIVDELKKKAAISPDQRRESIMMLEGMENSFIEAGLGRDNFMQTLVRFKNDTAEVEVKARLSTEPMQGVLDDLKKVKEDGSPAFYTDLNPEVRQGFIHSIIGAIEQERKRQEAERKAALREWRSETREILSQYQEMKLAGLPIPVDQEMQLFKRVKGTEFENKFNAIKSKGESMGFRLKMLNEDPLTNGAAMLGIQVQPLNMTNPQAMAQQLKERSAIGNTVKHAFNLTYTPVLNADEAKYLPKLFEQQGASAVQTVTQFTQLLGKDAMLGIAQQVAADEPQAGVMIAFAAQGKTTTAEAIAQGSKFMRDKTVKAPKDEDMRVAFNNRIFDALLGLPANKQAYYESFKSYYVAHAAKQGIDDRVVKDGIAQDAFKAVVGELTTINGKRIVIPEGYSESRFKDSIKLIDASTIRAMGGVNGLTDEDAAEIIRDDAQWYMTAEPNTYRPVINGMELWTKDYKKIIQFRFGK